MVIESATKKSSITQESQLLKKVVKIVPVPTRNDNKDSLVLQSQLTQIKEESCRRDFPDYHSLLQAYVNLKDDHAKLQSILDIILSQNKRAKRDPMSFKIYAALLKAAKGSTYSKIRLRVAFCILFVTGISLKVLLSLRVYQLTTLREKGWITINHYDIESTDSKAHLTEIGRIYLKEREEDFKSLFSAKTSNDFIFTSQKNPQINLRRETFTREINKVMSRVSHELAEKPNITSYSFRIGDITELWQNPTVIKSIQKTFDNN